MRISRFVLGPFCIGSLGAAAIIVGLPKPAVPPNVNQEAALSQRSVDYPVRPQISETLDRAVHLANAHDFNNALKLVYDANAFSNKTNPEIQEINQIHNFVLNRAVDRD